MVEHISRRQIALVCREFHSITKTKTFIKLWEEHSPPESFDPNNKDSAITLENKNLSLKSGVQSHQFAFGKKNYFNWKSKMGI